MNFPNEPTLIEKLTMLADTFRYRFGPMLLLAGLFMAKETPHLRFFGVAICIWVACEGLVKFYIDMAKVSRRLPE